MSSKILRCWKIMTKIESGSRPLPKPDGGRRSSEGLRVVVGETCAGEDGDAIAVGEELTPGLSGEEAMGRSVPGGLGLGVRSSIKGVI